MQREFEEFFNQWASTYDDAVYGRDEEYREVFENYEDILTEVAKRAISPVLEFGVGTGNLTQKLLELGHEVIGIEPSYEMRQIAKQKLPQIELYDGDFLQFPSFSKKPGSIVSSYAFHHLPDEIKDVAIRLYRNMLNPKDRIIFADTMFSSKEIHQKRIEEARKRKYHRLEQDLMDEYYPLVDSMKTIFSRSGFATQFAQLNKYVWLIVAEKI